MMNKSISTLVLAVLVVPSVASAAEPEESTLQLIDVFELEYAADPRISPDGDRIGVQMPPKPQGAEYSW
jgi:hypothetical protein